MSYDVNLIDLPRIKRYAELVARENRQLPVSTLADWRTREESRWFSKRTTLEQFSRPIDGWILLCSPEEGFADGWKVPPRMKLRIDAYESGDLLILGTDGSLRRAKYEHHETRNFSPDPNTNYGDRTTLTDVRSVVSGSDLTLFDHLGKWAYQEVKVRKSKFENSVLRREMRRSRSLKVPHAAMKTTLALRAFRGQKEFVQQIAISL